MALQDGADCGIDAPTIFSIAGFNTMKSQWISGLNNVFYMVLFLPLHDKIK